MNLEASQPIDTRDRILDAAEDLFVERGYAATSLRAIADRASVNLAATNYHFGSKQGLLAEVFHRRLAPINAQRLANLDKLEASGQPLTVRSILEAFFAPFVQEDTISRAPAIIGWIYSEPASVTRQIFVQEFTVIATRFQRALAGVLPHVHQADMRWRFHFLVGSMLHLLKQNAPLGSEPSQQTFAEGLEQLISYSIAGLEQKTAGSTNA